MLRLVEPLVLTYTNNKLILLSSRLQLLNNFKEYPYPLLCTLFDSVWQIFGANKVMFDLAVLVKNSLGLARTPRFSQFAIIYLCVIVPADIPVHLHCDIPSFKMLLVFRYMS